MWTKATTNCSGLWLWVGSLHWCCPRARLIVRESITWCTCIAHASYQLTYTFIHTITTNYRGFRPRIGSLWLQQCCELWSQWNVASSGRKNPQDNCLTSVVITSTEDKHGRRKVTLKIFFNTSLKIVKINIFFFSFWQKIHFSILFHDMYKNIHIWPLLWPQETLLWDWAV